MQSADTAPKSLSTLFTPAGEVADSSPSFSLTAINRLFASGALTPPEDMSE